MADGKIDITLEVGALDSSGIDFARPRVFFTEPELQRARERVRKDPSARQILDNLLKEAEEALALEMRPQDESWWDAAKDKPWAETYPEIYKRTGLEPGAYGRGAGTLATAWLLTGETKYADRACDIVNLLSSYQYRAEHYDVGMNYTGWGIQVLTAYDALGGRMSESERKAVDGMMSRLGAAVLKNDVYWIQNDIGGGLNNHLAWHKAMLGLLGLFYGRKDLVTFCIDGPRGLLPLLEDGLLDDGLWCESSLTYHFTAIIPMIWFAEAQRRNGVRPTLYEISGANGRTLKQPFDAMFHVLAPDGLIPPIGDAYGGRYRLWDNWMYAAAWGAWKDERHAWLLKRGRKPRIDVLFAPPLPESPSAPSVRTVLRPEHGYAFLRSHVDGEYWDNPAARCAFLTYDRSHVHANADRFSLMLFGQKRMLVSDVEAKATVPHAFSSRVQGELNRGALSQNTVMIDGQDQRTGPRMLRLVEFRDVPEDRRVTAVDEEGLLYEGVRQMRTIAMAPEYILDVFQVDCGATERQIDWIAHIMDETASMPREHNPLLEQMKPFELPTTGAWHWLRNARGTKLSELGALEWRAEDARLRLLLQGAGQLILCDYPATDEAEPGAIPMIMGRTRAAHAIFVALWLIGDGAAKVSCSPVGPRPGMLGWSVRYDGRERTHYLPQLRS